MPVSITCKKTEISPELHDLILKKVRKLKKYFEKVDRIDVVFQSQKFRRMCEITVHGAPFTLAAKAENGEEGAAFDKALRAMSRQIRDHKERMIDRKFKAAPQDEDLVEDEELETETA